MRTGGQRVVCRASISELSLKIWIASENIIAIPRLFVRHREIEYRFGSPKIHRCALCTTTGLLDPLRKFDRVTPLGRVNIQTRKGINMSTGTVKWFNGQKGFGFIQPDDGGVDVFVHISAVERAGMASLHEGQKIGFEMQRDARNGKMSAANLQAA